MSDELRQLTSKVRGLVNVYLEGWRLGDPVRSLEACGANFYYDDPNTGRIARPNFQAFVEDFKAYGASLNGGVVPEPFLEYSETVIDASTTPVTVWCWWRVTGTDFQGSTLVKADETGILSERIAYFSELP